MKKTDCIRCPKQANSKMLKMLTLASYIWKCDSNDHKTFEKGNLLKYWKFLA